jgi:hypothetical protein
LADKQKKAHQSLGGLLMSSGRFRLAFQEGEYPAAHDLVEIGDPGSR